MFRLESYISPLLMGYVDRYVKLNKEDFQLSLWGGDAVLNKLDLRLDVIEEVLRMPLSFKSGFIHELRLHVPWTRLYSEPVVITINTIECIVKLRTSGEESETGSAKSSGTRSASSSNLQSPKGVKSLPVTSEGEDLPPGYLQSLVNKIMNNVNIVINNLILKFVEDDIVLSLNVKSAECYSVDSDWNRSFIELAMPDLVLRRVLDFHDLTLCLDRRNASGKIEHYQDPVLYRCSLSSRLHMAYESLYSKFPSVTKLNIFCEMLDFSMTDIQLPLFYRLMDLCLALYYGKLDVAEIKKPLMESSVDSILPEPLEDAQAVSEEAEAGWVSWAWSYVPPILPTDQSSDVDGQPAELNSRGTSKKAEASVFIFGWYINEMSILFKRCEIARGSGYFDKMTFKPYVSVEFSSILMEIKMKGETFFDVQFGISGAKMALCCDVQGQVTGPKTLSKEPEFFKSGRDSSDENSSKINTLFGSLFDPNSPENNSSLSSYIFDEEIYQKTYSESYALDRFGFFWMSYMFTMEKPEGEFTFTPGSLAILNLNEKATIRFIIGPSIVDISSKVILNIMRIYDCLCSNECDSYCQSKKAMDEHTRRPPTDEEMLKLEGNVVTRCYHLLIVQPVIMIHPANLPLSDRDKNLCSKRRKSSSHLSGRRFNSLPVAIVQAERIEMHSSTAMYAKTIAEMCSLLLSPSEQILYNCHSHMNLKFSGIEASLKSHGAPQSSAAKCNIIQPWSFSYYNKTLMFPEFWNNPFQLQTDHLLEVECVTVNLTKAQFMLLTYVVGSWTLSIPNHPQFLDLSLMDDIFHKHSRLKQQLVLELTISDLQLQHISTNTVHAFTGAISSMHLLLLGSENGKDFIKPLLYGPLDVSEVYSKQFFKSPTPISCLKELRDDLLTFTCQIPKNADVVQAPGGVFVQMKGIAGLFDPVVCDWLTYIPSSVKSTSGEEPDTENKVFLNPSIAQATDPLKQSTMAGSDSDRSITESTGSHALHVQIQTSDVGKKSPSAVPASAKEQEPFQSNQVTSWKRKMADIFPFVKILEVEIDIQSCCLFFPSHRIHSASSSVDICSMLHSTLIDRRLPDTLVVCFPSVYIASAGRKKTDVLPSIPIKSIDHSIAGDKLPWTFKLTKFSLYSIHQSQLMLTILKPTSLSATVVVSPKYQPQLSETISQLGLCLHTDVDTVEVACSNTQVRLLNGLITDWMSSLSVMSSSMDFMKNLFYPISSVEQKPSDDIFPNYPSIASNSERRQRSPSKMTSTSSFVDAQGLAVINEISDSHSKDFSVDAVDASDDLGDIELTFWLQFTLAKLVCKLYTQDQRNNDIHLSTILEEVTSAVDVRDAYIKIKFKIGSFNAFHYMKRDGRWSLGRHDGIFMSSTRNLAQYTTALSQRNWLMGESTSCNFQSTAELKSGNQGRDFLTIVYTSAVTKNAVKKLQSFVEDSGSSVEKLVDYSKHVGIAYLRELCLTIQPCTAVFDGFLIAQLMNVFTLGKKSSSLNVSTNSENISIDSGWQSRSLATDDTNSSSPILTSQNMPLLYVNLLDFNLFFPTITEADRADMLQHVVDEDFFLLRIGSLVVVPQPENPLPRLVLEKSIYRRAIQAGITSQLGSEVEDRQYQINATELGIGSGNWRQLIVHENQARSGLRMIDVQNPALEWNTKSGIKKDDVHISVLSSGVDIKVIFAPAIVSSSPNDVNSKLVCGYSVEFNATSDIDVFTSVDQFKLVNQVLESNISSLWATESQNTSTESTIPSEEKKHTSGELMNLTPFDLLLTGGKISCIFYSHDIVLPENSTSVNPKVSSEETISSVSLVRFKTRPFLFCLFSQPHIVVRFHSVGSKAELSCYDFVVRGSRPANETTESTKHLPKYADFPVYWIETKPGKADSITGVLTSFCTVRLTDFLNSKAQLMVEIGRPVRINGSIGKIEQTIDFISRINSISNTTQLVGDGDYRPMQKQRPFTDLLLSYANQVDWLYNVRLKTDQLVFVMDATSSESDQTWQSWASVLLALTGIEANFTSSLLGTSHLRNLYGSVLFESLVLKTALNGQFKELLGPCSPFVNIQLSSVNHGSTKSQLSITLNCDTILLRIGPENVRSFNFLSQQFSQNTQGHSEISTPVKKQIPADEMQSVDFFANSESFDDLKSEDFVYITEEVENTLPNAGEVRFHSCADSNTATMTWRYSEPRVISKLRVNPVPFTSSQEFDDEDLKIPCILQYSLNYGRTFDVYGEFHLSGNSSCDAVLPELDRSNVGRLASSDLWRVSILYPSVDVGDDENEEHRKKILEPIVSPVTLATSLRIDSNYFPSLVPSVKFIASADCLKIYLINSLPHQMTADYSTKLSPYKIVHQLSDHEVAVVSFENLMLNAFSLGDNFSQLKVHLNTDVHCDVLEYSCLTFQNALDRCSLSSQMILDNKKSKMAVNLHIDKISAKIGPTVLHALNELLNSWTYGGSLRTNSPVLAHYIICNNTHETLHFGQLGTDERIFLQSREALPYFWRSKAKKQMLQVTSTGVALETCTSIDLNVDGTVCIGINDGSGRNLLVRILRLGNTQKQVIVSGQMSIGSHLSWPLQIKVADRSVSSKEIVCTLKANECSPSYLLDRNSLRGIKVRLDNSDNTAWSQEISINKVVNGQLIKLSQTEKTDHIHIWCHVVTQLHKSVEENLIVFSPLFVVRTHLPTKLLMNIETPRLRVCKQLELDGRGVEKQLNLVGRDVVHNITFQLGPEMQASSPAITLSSDTIEQVTRKALVDPDISELVSIWSGSTEDIWPYNSIDKSMPSMSKSQTPVQKDDPVLSSNLTSVEESQLMVKFEQPNIDLQINLSQYWPGLSTLLIDVVPYWLVVNETGLDIFLVDTDRRFWNLSAGKTFAPPIQKEFKLGLLLGGKQHVSDSVSLSDEEFAGRYQSEDDLQLVRYGYLVVTLPIIHDGLLIQQCYLTLHSTFSHEMRVVTIREHFSFINQTPFDVQIFGCVIPLGDQKVFIGEEMIPMLTVRKSAKVDTSQSLLLWTVLPAVKEKEPNREFNSTLQYIPYLCLRTCEPIGSGQWGYPLRLKITNAGLRSSIAVPWFDGLKPRTKACSLSMLVDSGIVFLVLAEELHPFMELHNNCEETIYFGQNQVDIPGFTVKEEVELVRNLPVLKSFSSTHYCPPTVGAMFPEVSMDTISVKLHFGGLERGGAEMQWSQAIDVQSDHSVFVSIPGLVDVKVNMQTIGHTLHLSIDPVSRADVSAKEIRSRIKGKEVVTIIETPGKSPQLRPFGNERDLTFATSGTSPSSAPVSQEKSELPSLQLDVCCFCDQVCVVLVDDATVLNSSAEVLRVSMDAVGVEFCPKLDVTRLNPGFVQQLTINVFDLQIDNQAFDRGGYDFPVVLLKQPREPATSLTIDCKTWFKVREKLESLSNDSLICVSMDQQLAPVALLALKISVKPIAAYIEDTFIWDILKFLDNLYPSSTLSQKKLDPCKLPTKIHLAAAEMNCPIRMRHLCIEPIGIQLSIHASMKLFLASDSAPLTLGKFERRNLWMTPQQLVKSVAIHYATSALLRAGLVVGSLEILGNPTGFVRNISSGVSDMFYLPYQGLMRGPGPCISGVSDGMRSVVRHFSTGTLTSISNFASSISRNMERLSMDNDHIQRNEVTRRRRPSGISEGLMNGLTGLGLSVLGAIAGVADQPLQTFTRTDMESSSKSDKAKGVVSGFGKGLIGMVAKPIGGAAELVSQTSMGILHGVGLVDVLIQRQKCSSPSIISSVHCSRTKLQEKVLDRQSCDNILICISDCQLISDNRRISCLIVLTCSCVHIIDAHEEQLLCTLPVTDINCMYDFPSKVFSVIMSADENLLNTSADEKLNNARVAAFVDTTSRFGRALHHSEFSLDGQADACRPIEPVSANIWTKHTFHVDNIGMMRLFHSFFNLAKNNTRKDMFAI